MRLERLLKVSILTTIMITLVCLMPPIMMPVSNIPVTMQTIMVLLIGLLLTPKEAFLSVFLYVILGALGLHVFSGGKGGIEVILGPTGGFIVLFPIVSFLVAFFKQKQEKLMMNLAISFMLMIGFLYLFASIWLMFYLDISYIKALIVLLPFVPLDIAKVIFTNLLYKRLPLHLLNIQTVHQKENKYE